MDTFEKFEHDLREALVHLHDPAYQPPGSIWAVTGRNPQQGLEAIQAALIEAIESLKPAPDISPNARVRRLYELLTYRYVQVLTQEDTAQRLGITPRHLRREQQQAIHALAQRLWEQKPGGTPSISVETPSTNIYPTNKMPLPEAPEPVTKSTAWRSQVRQELASLQQSAPGAVADVGATIRSVMKPGEALTSKHNVSLKMELAQPNLMASIHPTALRQILIKAIEKLVQHMSSGEIKLCAEGKKEHVKITISGYPTLAESLPHSDFIREALTTQDGSVEVQMENEQIAFQVTLPSADKITVFVVEDNPDLVHFYQRYTAGTRYQIVHVAEEERLFETIVDTSPDIIVLDVMLPGIDGWELLTDLHEHPDTRSIPVIVCSVVTGAELASALGAALYLPKPVRRQQFIQALDQVLSQGSTRASRIEANNATTY